MCGLGLSERWAARMGVCMFILKLATRMGGGGVYVGWAYPEIDCKDGGRGGGDLACIVSVETNVLLCMWVVFILA